MNSKTHFAALLIIGAFGYAWAARNDVFPSLGNLRLPSLATPPSDVEDSENPGSSDLYDLIAQWNSREGVHSASGVSLGTSTEAGMVSLGESAADQNSDGQPLIQFGDQLEELTSAFETDTKQTSRSGGLSDAELKSARQMAELLGLPLETFLESRQQKSNKTPGLTVSDRSETQVVPNPFLKHKSPQSALDLLQAETKSSDQVLSFEIPEISQTPQQPVQSKPQANPQPTQHITKSQTKALRPQTVRPQVTTPQVTKPQSAPVVRSAPAKPPQASPWVRPVSPIGQTDAPRFVPQQIEINTVPPRMSFKPTRTMQPGGMLSNIADQRGNSNSYSSSTHAVKSRMNVTDRWKSSEAAEPSTRQKAPVARPEIPWTAAFLSSAGRPFQTYSHSNEQSTKRVLVIGSLNGMDQPAIEVMSLLRDEIAARSAELNEWNVLLVETGNPDGYQMQRKGNSRGVDLNVNFPGHVSAIRGKTVATKSAEIETRMLMQIFQQYRPDRVVVLRNHPENEHQVVFSSTEERFSCLLSAPGPYQLHTSEQWNPGSMEQYARESMGADVVCVDLSGRQDVQTLWNENSELLWNTMTAAWTQGVPNVQPMAESSEPVANSFGVQDLPTPHSKEQLASALDVGKAQIVPEQTEEVASPVRTDVVELLPKPVRNRSKQASVYLLPKPKRNSAVVRP